MEINKMKDMSTFVYSSSILEDMIKITEILIENKRINTLIFNKELPESKRENNFYTHVAGRLNLNEDYTELLYYMLTDLGNDYFDDGSSPRGMWAENNCSEFLDKLKQVYSKIWRPIDEN